MRKYLYRLVLFTLICTVSSCIKDPIRIDLFPEKPNPGKFECYINGVDYVPDQGGFHLYGPVTTYVNHLSDGTYKIIIETSSLASPPVARPSVTVAIQNVTGTGTYEFNDQNYQYAEYSLYPASFTNTDPNPQPSIYRASTPGHGVLTLTKFDTKNSIITGTFWFNATNTNNPADSAKITGGHFNINYIIQ